jgi:predicted NBD/HSP70 family sugar kinase
VELDPAGRFTIAIDMSRHPVEAALLDLRGRIASRAIGKALVPRGRTALDEMHRVVAELFGAATGPALGIGIGVPGVVDRSGRVVVSEQLGWSDRWLPEELEDVYGIPVHVASDVEAAAVAEFGRTAPDPAGRMLYVKVDDRVAVSLITAARLNRTPVHGGDLTHLRVPEWEEGCGCGKVGCLGSRVSMIRILGPDYLEMSTEARKRLAVETTPLLAEATEDLGRVLAAIVAAVDANQVVIGGQLGEWGSVPEYVAAGITQMLGWCPEVTSTRLGPSAVVLGAAATVLSHELGVVWG